MATFINSPERRQYYAERKAASRKRLAEQDPQHETKIRITAAVNMLRKHGYTVLAPKAGEQ